MFYFQAEISSKRLFRYNKPNHQRNLIPPPNFKSKEKPRMSKLHYIKDAPFNESKWDDELISMLQKYCNYNPIQAVMLVKYGAKK
jgi:hypothetical protein